MYEKKGKYLVSYDNKTKIEQRIKISEYKFKTHGLWVRECDDFIKLEKEYIVNNKYLTAYTSDQIKPFIINNLCEAVSNREPGISLRHEYKCKGCTDEYIIFHKCPKDYYSKFTKIFSSIHFEFIRKYPFFTNINIKFDI